jgi:hypothetical protein
VPCFEWVGNTRKETMKKIVASVGLFAVGASGVHAAPGIMGSAEAAKPWSVSATLRGFYDDNVTTAPKGTPRTETFGFEVRPGFNLHWALEQSYFSLGYIYSFRYFEEKPPGNADRFDQSHTFNAFLSHAFSDRYLLEVTDSFVIGQEPDLLRATDTFDTFQRIPGDNIRNYGRIKFNAQITPLFGTELGYDNSFFKYDDEGGDETFPSHAGLLDRVEHYFHIDARWRILPDTVGLIGYRFGLIDYTADENIGFDPINDVIYQSDSRNSRSHYVYAGVEHVFRPNLSGSARVGGRYTDYYNTDESGISPYASASLSYVYAPDSSISVGLTHDMNATDLFSAQAGDVTTDAESTTVFGTLTHRIFSRLYGNVMAQFQNSSLNGGQFDNADEQYYLVGLNLEYRFNTHLSTHVGYNFDKLESDAGRSFDRNRVYVGVTAAY